LLYGAAEGRAVTLTLEDIRRAWEARDPELVKLVAAIAAQPDEEPETPIREGAATFDDFLREIRSWSFKHKPREEQMQYRIAQVTALEAPNAEVPLPARLRLHEIILALWQDDSPHARSFLLKIIATVPLLYGPWRAIKRIFKEAEAKNDTEIFGAIAARLDRALASYQPGQMNSGTLAYLVRRAWRFLRRTAQTLPACYADFAADVLAAYPEDTPWQSTWIYNHIVYHETKQYTRNRFYSGGGDVLEHRAFADLWQRTPRPLFSLLERAQSDTVRHFAAYALRTDFRAQLREVEPAWVIKLINVGSKSVDEFVIWILNNVPRFEQGAFRTLGLHDAVLRLFDSPADAARAYAADYARTHARDLGIPELIRLANNSHQGVRKLASDLLQERDPRKDVGLEAWGQLLDTDHGHKLAAAILRKHFGASELTPQWFSARLFTESNQAFSFITKLLAEVHPSATLGAPFFAGLIDRVYDTETVPAQNVTCFAVGELGRFDLNTLDLDFLRRLFLNPLTRAQAIAWINEGRLKPSTVPCEFFKALAFHPEWDSDPWLSKVREGPKLWMRQLSFSEELADVVLGWLADPRRFTPAEVGFDWLLQLVARSEPRYHDFAVETMTRAFTPADFAPRPGSGASLGGALVLFTGHMAGTTQAELETRVRKAGGVVAVGVSSKLHYLVIGDQDSALANKGPKTNKHTQAEDANAGGANIRILGEADFIRLLETPAPTPADPTLAGCERLWNMVVAPGPTDAPVAQFALRYLRLHHADIGAAETGQAVEAPAAIPTAFLTYERVEPLFFESRENLRAFGLELAKWEFARWNPAPRALLRLCEAPFADVREFVANALLADDAPEHRRYRLDPEVLSPAAVYSFCESSDESTRILGMILIGRSPRLRVPEELFRLAESPDRQVRAFVIRALWALYRDRGITSHWKPWLPVAPTIGASAKKAASTAAETRGSGAPARPSHPPASGSSLSSFLRRVLFEIPPARLKPSNAEEEDGIRKRLKPIPARKAKLALVDVMRDLALEDAEFARGILPLLKEFMSSRGMSEQAACLVAVTRIKSAYAVG
jgi:hypothetical protein